MSDALPVERRVNVKIQQRITGIKGLRMGLYKHLPGRFYFIIDKYISQTTIKESYLNHKILTAISMSQISI